MSDIDRILERIESMPEGREHTSVPVADLKRLAKIIRHPDPYPENPGSTHYENCWRNRGHHNCAIAHIQYLRDSLSSCTETLAVRDQKRASLEARLKRLEKSE
jgi:hypothetical protein